MNISYNLLNYDTFKNQKRLSKQDYYEYKLNNKKYIDELFPANDNSIYSQNSEGEFNDKKNGKNLKEELEKDLELEKNKLTINWERISDRIDYSNIYNEKISHEQIEQGHLSNCYLISFLASISHYPKLIIGNKNKETPHLLYNIEFGDIGYYEIMFFIDGCFKIIIIDDYIPFIKETGEPLFCKSSENNYWVNLLEKAYAKICGGYTSTIIQNNENIYDHCQVLTGFKCINYQLYEENNENNLILNSKNIDNIFNIIEENLINKNNKFNIIITANSPEENKGIYLEENYIPYNHAFSIIDYKIIKINNDKNEMKLLLINNPWGRNVYNDGIGKYCIENINEDTISLKPYIESNINSIDGTFWIDYDTFVKNYYSIKICKIPCNYHIRNYNIFENNNLEKPFIFKLIINKKSNIFFNINVNRSESIINHQCKYNIYFFLIINKIDDNGNIIKTFSKSTILNDLQFIQDLENGNYIVWLYIQKIEEIKDDIKANFMVSCDNEINIEFIKYDENFKYILNASEKIFNLNNNIIEENNEDKLTKTIIDKESLDGFFIIFCRNISNDKKIEGKHEIFLEGIKLINDSSIIDQKNYINFILEPGECVYYLGIINSKKQLLEIKNINIEYTTFNDKKHQKIEFNLLNYLNEKNNVKFNLIENDTNSFCYIKTNFNKNKDKREEENLYKYFQSLMESKLSSKGININKIKDISKNIWDNMKEEDKNKIKKKYEDKIREYKNNILTFQVLKYIKKNSIKIDKNNIDDEIENMKIKTKLSNEFKIAQFEDDLIELEKELNEISSQFELLKFDDEEEIELNDFINKHNLIRNEINVLFETEITKENALKLFEQNNELCKNYNSLFEQSIIQKIIEKFEIYKELIEEFEELKNEINKKIKIINEKNKNYLKKINDIIKNANELNEKIKNLKLLEIITKTINEIITPKKEILNKFENINKKFENLINDINEKNNKIKEIQNEIFSEDKFNEYEKKFNELKIEINKYKNLEQFNNELNELIEIKNKLENDSKLILNNINKDEIKNIIENYKNFEISNKNLYEKINNFRQEFIIIMNNYNELVKNGEDYKNEILEIYNQFNLKEIPLNEHIEKTFKIIIELKDEINKLIVVNITEKMNILIKDFEKIQNTNKKIIEEIKNILKKDDNSVENDNSNDNNKTEIIESVDKKMIELENEQNEIIKELELIINNKDKCKNEIDNLNIEMDNILKNIKEIFNNDINYINIQNIKDNFEKYNNFNKKYIEICEKIISTFNKHSALVKSYNDFISKEYNNRKKIFDNINILYDNKIKLNEKYEKIFKNSEKTFNDLQNCNINELKDIFDKDVNIKMEELNQINSKIVQFSKI